MKITPFTCQILMKLHSKGEISTAELFEHMGIDYNNELKTLRKIQKELRK